jgi:hypothetical protein
MREMSTSVPVLASLKHYRCLKEHEVDRTTANLTCLFVRINTCMEKMLFKYQDILDFYFNASHLDNFVPAADVRAYYGTNF